MHGGNLLEAMERYEKSSFIDLSANINPFGPPKEVWEAMTKALPKIIHYPDPEYRRLRRGLAQTFDLPLDWILMGNGAGELLFSILQALRPKKVLLPVPSFSEYERAARACGAEITTLPLGVDGWGNLDFKLGYELDNKLENKLGQELVHESKHELKHELEVQLAFNEAMSKIQEEKKLNFWKEKLRESDLLLLNSPHNPTGSLLERNQFERFLSLAQESGTWVILDESFVDFLDDERRWSGREYLKDYPNLIVLYSMTKFYALPGLRLGAVFAEPNILEKVKEHRDPWAVNILAEEAGIVAIEDQEYPERVRRLLRESKEYFFHSFEQAQLTQFQLLPCSVNFALIKILNGRSKDIVETLARRGILVRDCGNFQGLEGEFIRVAIKDIPSMQALIKEMQAINLMKEHSSVVRFEEY